MCLGWFCLRVYVTYVCVCVLEQKGLKEKLECVESVNFDSNFFVVGLHQKELKICYS